jgi:small subunit ribosomal protein S18
MSVKKKKICPIDEAGVKHIDYKDTTFLRKYLTKFNRIIPRYYSGVSLANQKKLATAIKRARYMALLPYVLEVTRPTSTGETLVSSAPVVESTTLDETTVAV